MFTFVLSAPAQRCDDVRMVRHRRSRSVFGAALTRLFAPQLSRSYSEEIRTRSYTACSTQAADGFALVLYDAPTRPLNATTVGAGGGGLGYAGLPNSVAIEFDTMGDPSLDEPAVAHVAVLSRGVRPASLIPSPGCFAEACVFCRRRCQTMLRISTGWAYPQMCPPSRTARHTLCA